MATLDVYNQQGKKVSQLDIAKFVEGPVRQPLLLEMIKMQRANRRRGTASTKTRGRVSGSTRKIYRQKGTGNARHGDIKAPLFVGGGRVWGPHGRDYSYRLPRKARQVALKSALTLKFREGKLKVIDSFSLPEIKTRKALEIFNKLGATEALLVIHSKDEVVEKSIRNLSHHKVLRAEGINVYDLLNFDQVILTEAALQTIRERFK